MNNKVSDGATVPYANSSGSTIPGGTVVVILDQVRAGVAVKDIPDGETGDLLIQGVVEVAAENGGGLNWDQGAAIYYDTADSNCNDDATGNTPLGWAWEAKGATDTTGKVKLAG